MAYHLLLRRSIPRNPFPNPFYLSSSFSSSPSPSPSPSSDSDPDDVVSSTVSILTGYRSKTRWLTLLAHYPQGFTPFQVSQILLQIRRNYHLSQSFFRFTVGNALTSHDLHSLSTMIHICARARRKLRAQVLIRSAIRISDSEMGPAVETNNKGKKKKPPRLFEALVSSYRSCDSAPFVFDLLIRAYLELNRIDTCLQIVSILRCSGISPVATTCNALISHVIKHRGFDSGYGLYRDLFLIEDGGGGGNKRLTRVKPNVETFNWMMLSCYHDGMVDKAEELWVEMLRLDCKPNSVSYNILMASYSEEGEMDKAEKLWEEMRMKELKRDAVSYNTMIGAWCKIGEIAKAEQLYREMEMCQIEATCITYQHLVAGHCRAGDLASALLLLKDMRRKGFSPDGPTIDLVVLELCDKGPVIDALEFFRGAMKDSNFAARRSSYEVLIKGLCGAGEMDEALKLQAQMVGNGFKPDSQLYGAFIDGYTKMGKIDTATKLQKELVKMQGLENK